jgi:hypothetical protein
MLLMVHNFRFNAEIDAGSHILERQHEAAINVASYLI